MSRLDYCVVDCFRHGDAVVVDALEEFKAAGSRSVCLSGCDTRARDI